MLPLILNNETGFFTVSHVTRPPGAKLIYGIRLNNLNYYISKSPGIDDCEQLDSNPPLKTTVMKEICAILTEIENEPKKRLSLAWINERIFAIIGKLRTLTFNALR